MGASKAKRQARARAERTGEGYQKALLAIRAGQPEPTGPLAGQPSPRIAAPKKEDR